MEPHTPSKVSGIFKWGLVFPWSHLPRGRFIRKLMNCKLQPWEAQQIVHMVTGFSKIVKSLIFLYSFSLRGSRQNVEASGTVKFGSASAPRPLGLCHREFTPTRSSALCFPPKDAKVFLRVVDFSQISVCEHAPAT